MINNKSHKEKIGSGITRRGFLSRASQLGWASMMATFAGSLYGGFKFMVPNVLYEPPTIFKIGTLDEFGMGVDTRLVKERQIWLPGMKGDYMCLLQSAAIWDVRQTGLQTRRGSGAPATGAYMISSAM